MAKKILIFVLFFAVLASPWTSNASDASPAVGEAFGRPVLKEEFDSAYKTVQMFPITDYPADEDDKRAQAWMHVAFLRAAEEQNIEVARPEVEAELATFLKSKNISPKSYRYYDFTIKNFGEAAVVFEKRLENFLKVKKLLERVTHPPPPNITDEEAKQKFLNQYNSMAVEFVNFPAREQAEKFYKETSGKKWTGASPTGHISVEALIDLWQVPLEDAYRIHSLSPGKVAKPVKMRNGWGVFRLLEKKKADLRRYTEKKKNEYIRSLEQLYYYSSTEKAVRDILDKAALKDYEKDSPK